MVTQWWEQIGRQNDKDNNNNPSGWGLTQQVLCIQYLSTTNSQTIDIYILLWATMFLPLWYVHADISRHPDTLYQDKKYSYRNQNTPHIALYVGPTSAGHHYCRPDVRPTLKSVFWVTRISAAVLARCLSNFRAMRRWGSTYLAHSIPRLLMTWRQKGSPPMIHVLT